MLILEIPHSSTNRISLNNLSFCVEEFGMTPCIRENKEGERSDERLASNGG